MEKAIEVLMGEHRLIEQALGSLETYAALVREGIPPWREVIGDYAAFFRGFADTCHHGKEEDILFQRMMDRRLPARRRAARGHVPRARARAAHVQRARRPGVRHRHASSARDRRSCSATSRLRRAPPRPHPEGGHVLYPLALRMLTGPELDAMNTQFEAFETQLRAEGLLDRLSGSPIG